MFVSLTNWFKRHWWDIKGVAAVLFLSAFVGGWVANLVKTVLANFDVSDDLTALRIVGIVFYHLGAVLGYF
jgi:hypothetical protein